MRVVLANPPGYLDNGSYIQPFPSRCDWVGPMKSGSTYYPYELAYLSSILKQTGIPTVLLDGQLSALTANQYLNLIRSHRPDILVAECAHLSYPTMTRILRELPGVTGVLVGPYGSAFPDKCAADGWVVISGEFEYKVLAFLTGRPEPTGLVDIDSLPLPEDDDIHRIDYWEEACIVRPMIQGYATRGCTVRCEFCTSPIYYGGYDGKPSHRVRDIDRVCAEIEHLADRYAHEFAGMFWNDETHNANMPWLRSFAHRLIDRGLSNFVYEAMCGYWTMKPEDIELLRRAGYQKLRFGVESLTNSGAGGKTGKRVIPDRLYRVLEACKANGVRVHLTTMIGSMGSSEAGDLDTLDELIDLKAKGLADTIQHSITTPNPGTRFWQTCKDNGWLITEDTDLYHWHSGAVNYPDYSAKQVEETARKYYLLHLDWRFVP